MPTTIHKNVAFIDDTCSLENNEDISCDDMGVWKNNRVDKTFVSVTIGEKDMIDVMKCARSQKKGIYLVKRVYRIHRTDNSLRKITTTIYSKI